MEWCYFMIMVVLNQDFKVLLAAHELRRAIQLDSSRCHSDLSIQRIIQLPRLRQAARSSDLT